MKKILSKNIRIEEDDYLIYKDLKKKYGVTMTRIFLKGLDQYKKSIKAKEKYAKENSATLAFMVNKIQKRIEITQPRRGWFQIIFIKNIVKTSLNTVEVHYLNYQFLNARKELRVIKKPIEHIDIALRKQFIR